MLAIGSLRVSLLGIGIRGIGLPVRILPLLLGIGVVALALIIRVIRVGLPLLRHVGIVAVGLVLRIAGRIGLRVHLLVTRG